MMFSKIFFSKSDGLYADGLVLRLWSQKNHPDGSSGLVLHLFQEFKHGWGPEVTIMSEQNELTQELMQDPQILECFAKLAVGDFKHIDWGLSDVVSTLSCLKQFLGSYDMRRWDVDGKSLNIVYDSKSEHSWLYHANDISPFKYIETIQDHSRSVRREFGKHINSIIG